MEKAPLGDEMCQKWFAKFHAQDFLHRGAPRAWQTISSSWPSIQILTEERPGYAMRETGDILKVSKLSTENHLHLHDYVNRFEVWVPHILKGWGGLS